MSDSIRHLWTCCIVVLLSLSSARGAKNDWAEGTQERFDGATRDYYNRGGALAWHNFMGDWRDAENAAQGDVPYATVAVVDDDKGKFVEWDVTGLVREWINEKYQNQGFFLRTIADGGTIVFCSRENPSQDHRPRLIVVGAEGSKVLEPLADTYLTKSTYRSQGHSEELRVSGAPDNMLLRFDVAGTKRCGQLSKATLQLYTTKQYGSAEIGVFRCQQGQNLPPSDPILGLAARYPGDKNIGDDPSVVFSADFETEDWPDGWTYAGKMEVLDIVDADPKLKFERHQGKALRVKIAEGSTGALNTLYKFKKEVGEEPEEIFFRYYLRLADDWNQTLQGGKMPGISGTYGVAGWGGRKVDGTDGWSARGSFSLTIPEGNPLAGLTPIGSYCYHADMTGYYGNVWIWQEGYRGFLENNRWYCVEQYLKMNAPGEKDGIIRAWIDGRPAFEKTDIRFRLVDKLKIEQIWMNVYHGGKKPSPYDQHLYIDNVVIAREYIGPMKRTP